MKISIAHMFSLGSLRARSSLNNSLIVLTLLAVLLAPEQAFAGGITEFTGPLEKFVNTITGTAGKLISVGAMAITFVAYMFSKDDLSGGFKTLLTLVFGISGICFAGGIINTIFPFASGAVI